LAISSVSGGQINPAITLVAWVSGGLAPREAAILFTSSTSFANPAATLARSLSNTFAGIAPTSAATFVLAEQVGALLGLVLVQLLYPRPESDSRD
jgi:glycerol uptake facilitator-like aquaporin